MLSCLSMLLAVMVNRIANPMVGSTPRTTQKGRGLAGVVSAGGRGDRGVPEKLLHDLGRHLPTQQRNLSPILEHRFDTPGPDPLAGPVCAREHCDRAQRLQ